MLPQPFDGYPYVVTRIGHTALRSVAVVPIDWSRERLIDLTRRQAIANQLETCLCLGPAESVFVTPDGTATRSDLVPVGIPVLDGEVVWFSLHGHYGTNPGTYIHRVANERGSAIWTKVWAHDGKPWTCHACGVTLAVSKRS